MSFAKNHMLHFFIVLIVLMMSTLGIWKYLNTIEMATYDASRLSSARLIVNSLEGYQKQKGVYPNTLLDLQDFIFPIPRDPQTQKLFEYERVFPISQNPQTQKFFGSDRQGSGYVLRIPQHEKEDIILKK